MLRPHFRCSLLIRIGLLSAMITFCYGSNFEKCKLARKLSSNGYRHSEIRTTLCYASLSEYNNQFLVIMHNETFYGLFAIHEPWCAPGTQATSAMSKCNAYCKSMLDDHLRNDINCLRKMFDGDGRWSAEFKQFYETNSLLNLVECEETILNECGMSNETETDQILLQPPAVC